MRLSTRFSVTGGNHHELVEKATATWRQVSGQPGADLPQWTKIDVTPSIDTQFGDGRGETIEWEADVYVPAQPITPGSRY